MRNYNSPFDLYFAVPKGKVMKKGSSVDLEKGQLGIFDVETSGAPTAVNYFGNFPKNKKFEIRVGRGDVPATRSGGNFNMSSVAFSLRDIVEIRGINPDTNKLTVDDVIIGYNGIDEDTSLTFRKGESVNLYLRLTGPQIGLMGYENATVDVPFTIDAPLREKTVCEDMCEDICKDVDCLPIVLQAIERLKEFPLRNGLRVKDVIEVKPVHHCKKAPDPKQIKVITYNQKFSGATADEVYTLLVEKFPDRDFKKVKDNSGNTLIYLTVTEFDKLEDNTVELKKTARSRRELETLGFTNIQEFKEGFAYSVIADVPTENGMLTITNILKDVFKKKDGKTYVEDAETNEIPFVVEHKGFDFNKSTFVVYSDTKLDITAIEKNKDLRDRMTFKYLGEVSGHAKGSKSIAITSEKIKEAKAAPLSYVIDLPDNEKTGDRLEELQKFYPDFKIEVTKQSGGCKTRYCTNVLSEPVDNECSFIYEDLFSATAPADYKGISWKPADSMIGTDCLCGVHLIGKVIKIKPSECVEDEIPFIEDSVGIAVSNRFVEGAAFGTEQRFKEVSIEYRTRRSVRTNLAGHLRNDIKSSAGYFTGNFPLYKESNVSKFLRGETRLFDPEAQIVDFSIKVRFRHASQTFSRAEEDDLTYHIIVEYGYQDEVKEVLNNLASAAGLDAIS